MIIDARFNGPPDSGNGGYCCGRFALNLHADPTLASEVTLRSPPPLNTPLQAVAVGEAIEIRDADQLVATVGTTTVDFKPLPAPNMHMAKDAENRYPGFENHPFSGCFVCGPERAEGDGLRLFPGSLDAQAAEAGPVCCHWQPSKDLGDEAGNIKPEFVWAALDCPTYFGAYSGRGMVLAVLGRQAVKLLETSLPVNEPYTIQSWLGTTDGRKSTSFGALYREGGECVALCRATWVELQ